MHKAFLIVLLTIQFAALSSARADDFGKFVGRVVTAWKDNGRTMELIEPFRYIAPNNVIWHAPQGSEIDGASIPRFAWSFIGGPFEGKYRDASVIHDIACDTKYRPWQDVHRAFYTAMMASGVDPAIAKIMYAAVYYFGPRWSRQVQIDLGAASDGDVEAKRLLISRASVAKRPDEAVGIVAAVTEIQRPVPSTSVAGVGGVVPGGGVVGAIGGGIAGDAPVGAYPKGAVASGIPGITLPSLGALPPIRGDSTVSPTKMASHEIVTLVFPPLLSQASQSDFAKVEKAIKEENLTIEQIESFFQQR